MTRRIALAVSVAAALVVLAGGAVLAANTGVLTSDTAEPAGRLTPADPDGDGISDAVVESTPVAAEGSATPATPTSNDPQGGGTPAVPTEPRVDTTDDHARGDDDGHDAGTPGRDDGDGDRDDD